MSIITAAVAEAKLERLIAAFNDPELVEWLAFIDEKNLSSVLLRYDRALNELHRLRRELCP